MTKLVSKCGIDCGACPWGPYPRKGMTAEVFEQYRNDAKRILGYMPIKTSCPTCQTPDSEISKGSKLPNRKCLIRQCVDKAGMVNCAHCTRFPCNTVKATGGVWNRKNMEERLGAPISHEEYHVFIEPFEGIDRLQDIRASLKSEELVEPAKATTSDAGITDFPVDLSFSKEETTSFKAIHRLLSAIIRSPLGLRDTDTFAQWHSLEDRRANVLRFLWILGRYGELEKDKSTHLVIDAGTFEANRSSEKKLAIWAFVKDTVFKALSEFGVHGECIALKGVKEEDLTTGTGYLRSKGWVMKMSFEEKIGGAAAIRALQTYTRRLDEKYGEKAFRHFDADMRFLSEK